LAEECKEEKGENSNSQASSKEAEPTENVTSKQKKDTGHTTSLSAVEHKNVEVKCLKFGKVSDTFIIRTQEQYQQFAAHKTNFKKCKGYQLPKIDFDQYILIGAKTTVSGCETPDYKRQLLQGEQKKKYVYKLDITQHGECERAWQSFNTIKVKNIPKDQRITFDINKK
jgi:hypothetical protein